MPAPISSNRVWERDAGGNSLAQAGMHDSIWVRDSAFPSIRAIFKTAPAGPLRYPLGMERVAYVLGEHLGLPIPPVFLDTVEKEPGSAMLRIGENARTLLQAGGSPMLMANVIDRDAWPLCVAFDLWIGNYDRAARNLMLEPVPPEKKPQLATSSRTWLIDNGVCGLWWPRKFDPSLKEADLEKINVGAGDFTDQANTRLREIMPDIYRKSFSALGSPQRTPHLDRIRLIADSQIDVAVSEVSNDYFSAKVGSMTAALLRARRDNLAKLANDVFPV